MLDGSWNVGISMHQLYIHRKCYIIVGMSFSITSSSCSHQHWSLFPLHFCKMKAEECHYKIGD